MQTTKTLAILFGGLLICLAVGKAQPWDPFDAGISDDAADYINTMEYAIEILDNPSFQNCLTALIHSETVPTDAIELTNVDDFASMTSGNTYVIRGDFTITKEISIPSRCTVYVDGHIHRDGKHDGNGENSTWVIFRIASRSQVNLVGVNNARLTGNMKVTAVYVDQSTDVTVQGFDISDMWEGLVARRGNKRVIFKNNYVHNTDKRAVWLIVSDYCEVVHNFLEMPQYDGIDIDAYAKNNICFENVVIGAGRWTGFVEEAAAFNKFISNVGIMKNNPGVWQLGWVDHGTTEGVYNQSGELTRENYFINNVMANPDEFTNKKGGANYEAIAKTVNGVLLKGKTYFWGNIGYDCGKASGDRFLEAEWLDEIPQQGLDWIAELDAKYNSTTIVQANRSEQPGSFALMQNYPNPFNPKTTIRYFLEKSDHVNLSVFNLIGRKIAVLVDNTQAAGSHAVTFSGEDLPAGVYIYSLRTSSGTLSRKMILSK